MNHVCTHIYTYYIMCIMYVYILWDSENDLGQNENN